MTTLHLGTRKSALALWQATYVRDRLLALHPGLNVTLVPMTTAGDRQLSGPLMALGGKALFTKELEQGLGEGRIDLAVHSMKDVVAQLPDGLTIGAILEREDPRDALVSPLGASDLDSLPAGARIGTASLRRACQIRHRRPDLHIENLRGNVNSRLARLDAGEFSAIILAAAGLKRLGLAARISGYLPIDKSLPAASQGAIGIECRLADTQTRALIAPLHHPDTALCVVAERAVTGALEGGCRLPIAAFATLKDDQLTLRALVGEPDGSRLLIETRSGSAAEATTIARAVTDGLLSQGAGAIIERLLKEGT
ncbi:hydroxymethylbilane synthase [Acidiferrobacter sp.]|uniref:hydroxymethylbilane synthase n=1 Tax=Acidiferrobacter sp. TaxID=1872107 RepID=UPI002623E4AD|nr:hydroxymethylbilane synthase [Acidiferrobacter sp.]